VRASTAVGPRRRRYGWGSSNVGSVGSVTS
jgi:hypothetical protein